MARIELNVVAMGDFKSVNSQLAALKAQVDGLNKSLSGVGLASSSNLAKQLQETNAAFKATMLSTGQFTANTVRLKAETDKFGESLVSGKLKLTEYFSIIKNGTAQAGAQMRALALEQTKLQNSVVMSDPTKQGVMSVYTPTKINAVANATKIAANMQNLYNIAVDKGTQSLINWGKNTQWAGRQLTVGMTVPLTIFGSTAMKVFSDVNAEIVRLQKVYGTGLVQPTKQALTDISNQVTALSRELASSMGVAAKDTAAMAADLAATGLQGNDLLNSTRESIRLSKLGELDTQSAMKATISLQNVYKLSTQQLSGAVDFLNAVENQTSTSLQDLVDGIPRVGPIVQQLGGSFKDTAVMMVAMKEAGVPAAQSANAIKSAIASLINPTKQAKEAFAGYNINLANIASSTGGNPVQMIMQLQQALKGLQPLAQAQLIEKLFGKFQEARIQALITNLGAATSQTKTAFELMNASSGQLASIAAGEMKTATESVTGRYKRAMETLKADLIPVGQKIMEIATTLMNFGNSVAKVFSGLPGPVKTVMGVLAAGVALSGPIIMFTGVLANFVGYLLKGLFAMKNLVTGTKTFGQLFTPEIIASQNAADLFSKKMLEDASAVDLLNGAVISLTRSIEAMSGAMTASSTTAFLEKAALSIPFKAPRLATGGWVPGNPSEGDAYPAMLMGGEAVIPTKQAQQYAPFINGILKGNLPGYAAGHTAMPFGPGSSQYSDMLNKYPSLAQLISQRGPDSVRIVSNLVNTSMNQRLNTDLRSGVATPESFEKGFGNTGGLGFARSAALGGLNATSESKNALKEFETELKRRVLALKKTTLSDQDLADETRKLIDEQMHAQTAMGEVSKALHNSSQQVGQVRVNAGADYVRSGIANGSLQQRGTLAYLNELPVGQIRNKNGKVTDYAINQAGGYQGSPAQRAGSRFESSLEPFANSPQFQPKIDLSGPSGNMARSSGSYTRTHNLILDKMKRDEELAKQLNIESESASPSKATKRAAKNMVDGAVEGIKEAKPRIKAAANTAMEEALLANQSAGNVASEAENLATMTSPGMASTTKNKFARFQAGRMKVRAKMTSKLPSALTGRFGGLGLGLGLQVAQQFAGPAINKLPGGSIANDAISGASFGSFLGPEGAAAGAAIGIVIGGLSKLISTHKHQQEVARAAFTSSASAAAVFGGATADASTPLDHLSATLSAMAPKVNDVKTQVQQFTDEISKLPKDDPMSLLLEKLNKTGSGSEAAKLAKAFADTQVAINGMDPKKAQQMMDLYLKSTGHADMVGKVKIGSASDSTSAYINSSGNRQSIQTQDRLQYMGPRQAPKVIKGGTASSYKDLSSGAQNTADKLAEVANQAINTKSLDDYNAKIKAIQGSYYDTTAGAKMYAMAIQNQSKKAGDANDVLSKSITTMSNMGLTLSQIIALEKDPNSTKMIDKLVADQKKGDLKAVAADMAAINKSIAGSLATTPGAGGAGGAGGGGGSGSTSIFSGTTSQKEMKKLLEARQKDENVVLKGLNDQLKTYKQQAAEAKRILDYENQRFSLMQDQKTALMSGNYLGAAELKQASVNLGVDFNATTKENQMQATVDKIQLRADEFATALADLNDAIANGSKAIDPSIKKVAGFSRLAANNAGTGTITVQNNITISSLENPQQIATAVAAQAQKGTMAGVAAAKKTTNGKLVAVAK
jgi:TP901 family phage tail tape measure protein